MSDASRRILIAGLGNIFLGDDAFGVEVARRLTERPPPDNVRVVDFGIRGVDLTYELLDGYDLVILVDAVCRGGPPGTIYVIEPQVPAPAPAEQISMAMLDPHDLDPAKVLRLVSSMGGQVGRLVLVGCEPTPMDEAAEMTDGLSEPVRQAVGLAIELIEKMVADEAAGRGPGKGVRNLFRSTQQAYSVREPCEPKTLTESGTAGEGS